MALLTLIALRPTDVPPLADVPTTFDGRRAHSDLRTLAQEFPNRLAGSDANVRSMMWLSQRIADLGLRPRYDQFVATIEGAAMPLQNVWAESKGDSDKVILLIANRDSPPFATQGANDNASGVAALLELARIFTVQRHTSRFIFLWSDGDAYGGVGSQQFIEDHHPELDIRAAVALREVGAANATFVELRGWSATDRIAPPWMWALANSAGRAEARLPTPLPNIFSQGIRLAMPVGGGTQAPFVGAGVAALQVSAGGRALPADRDTVDETSARTLRKLGRTVERMVTSIDAVEGNLPGSGTTVFFSRNRAMSGVAVTVGIVALLLPLAAVTFDLRAAARRRRARLGPAILLYLLRLAPWFVMLVLVYFANLVGLLPHSTGAAIPPESLTADNPRWVRVFLLVLVLVLVAIYAHAMERRLLRRTPVPRENTVTVVHLALMLAAVLVLLVNPFSLLIILPAAVLWPLARAGGWQVSRLPAWAGLGALAVSLGYFGMNLDLGWDVWWYFFLLLEDGTVPIAAAILGIIVMAAAIHLGHHLYRPREVRRGGGRLAQPKDLADDQTPPPTLSDDGQTLEGRNAGGLQGGPERAPTPATRDG